MIEMRVVGLSIPNMSTPGRDKLLAVLEVKAEAIRLRGMRLYRMPDGGHYIRGPASKGFSSDFVGISACPERDALVAQAVAMLDAMQAAQQPEAAPEA